MIFLLMRPGGQGPFDQTKGNAGPGSNNGRGLPVQKGTVTGEVAPSLPLDVEEGSLCCC